MNQSSVEPERQLLITVEEWNELRHYLRDSVMAKASLGSLAKNVGLKWPIRGKNETPERYIYSTLAELADMAEFYGKGNRLSLLCTILRETKRLDDPFTEMTDHLDRVIQEEIEVPPIFLQLEVPPELPVELTGFSARTLTLCLEGRHQTISQLIEFLRSSSSAVNINDEFRQFIEGLEHRNANSLEKFLPIREGCKGIYLAEALGHIGRRLTAPQAATLLYAYKISTTKLTWSEDAALPKTDALSLIATVQQAARKAFNLMPDQAQQLRCAVESGIGASVRFLVSLGDPDLEGLALAIAMAALDVKPRLKGLIGRLLS